MLDGVRLNNAIYRSGHLQNIITIDESVLENTEVVFGPSSVLYGSDALGGTINMLTKKLYFRMTPTLKVLFLLDMQVPITVFQHTNRFYMNLKKFLFLTQSL